MKLKFCFFVAWIFCILLGCSWAQSNATPPTTQPPQNAVSAEVNETGIGAIRGQVVSEDGPLAFVQVILSPVTQAGMGPRLMNNTPRFVQTNAEGNFKADGLPAGVWRVNVLAQGYVLEGENGEEPQRFYRIGETATVRMVKGGIITGRVVNAGGEPVVGIPVSAQFVRDAQGKTQTAAQAGLFQTDDRGIYRIYGLAAGNYLVSAGRTIAQGLDGVRPNPYAGDAPTYHPSATRDTALEVSVSPGAVMSGIDIQYRSIKGHTISGKITGLENASNTGFRGGFGGAVFVLLAQSIAGNIVGQTVVQSRNGNLTFSFSGISDGEYEVTAQMNAPGENDFFAAPRKFTVSGRDVTGLTLALMPSASITATLIKENEVKEISCPPERKPAMQEQLFQLLPELQGTNNADGLRRRAMTFAPQAPDRNGVLTFPSLAAGRYWLSPLLLAEHWYLRGITAPAVVPKTAARNVAARPATIDLSKNGITLKAGEKLQGVLIKVSEGAGTVTGKVLPTDGAGLPGLLQVVLVPLEKERAEDQLRYATANVANDGSFKLKNLAPGKYFILPQIEPNDLMKKISQPLERAKLRREAEAANSVIELQPCQKLSNYVLRLKK